MSRLDEMEINEINGASVDELRCKAKAISSDEGNSGDEHCKDSSAGEAKTTSLLVAEFRQVNPLLDFSTAEKMITSGITCGQVEELLKEDDHRRSRIKFICDRIEGLNSREIASMVGIKHANAIYKHVDKLNEEYEEEGFYYELVTRGQKKAPTKRETEQYEQRLVSL